MKRRAFLLAGGQWLGFALTARATSDELPFAEQQTQIAESTLEQRVARVLQAYDAQGNHRTGTELDSASAKWLVNQVRHFGIKSELESFSLSRIDPQSCYLHIAGRRIDGVPLFDGGFTPTEGVSGRLGPFATDAEIGLVESEPSQLAEPGIERRNEVAEARRSPHKAVVVLTRGAKPGLFLINASAFSKPFGPPMLQISSAETDWLKAQAQSRAEATLIAQVKRTGAEAFNVVVKIAGSNPTLAPLVLMAPRSAWWQCVSEQGSRLACWLEAIRVLASSHPARDCLFVALSGHELGLLGIGSYIERRPNLVKGAHAWIFFGSDIGAPRQPNLIHASDDVLEQWTVAAMEKEGLTVNAKARHDSKARGEAAVIQKGGGRFVTIACGSDVYHSVADRWPEAVDVATLARYAKAFAIGATQLAAGDSF